MAMLVAASSGCVMAPSIPGGPLQGTGISGNVATGYEVARGTATLAASRGRTARITDGEADGFNGLLVPTRLGGRVGIVDWVDVAGDAGWGDGGVEARVGLPEGSRPLPVALAMGYRSGAWGLAHGTNQFLRETRARIEAYPRLLLKGSVRLHLVTALGVSVGNRYHVVTLPEPYANRPGVDSGPSLIEFTRDETRVEAAIGIELRRRALVASFVALPYATVAGASIAHDACGCWPWHLAAYEQGVGAAFFATIGFSLTPWKHDAAPRDGR